MENFDFQYKSLDASDLSALEGFFSKVYKESVQYGSSSSFNWKIFDNVSSRGIINAAYFNKNIVSTTTITPKSLFLKGDLIQAAEIGDTYTDEQFQRKGLFASLVQKSRSGAESAGIKLVYGTPNSNSLPGYLKKCDFKVIESLDVFSYTLPLGLEFLKGNGIPNFIINILDGLYSPILRFFLRLKSSGGTFNEIQSFTNLHDSLWEKIIPEYEFVFSKKSSVLNWRFINSPYSYSAYNLFFANSFCGYVVTRLDSNTETLFIADFLCDPSQIVGFKKAFAALVLSKKNDCKRINLWMSRKDFALPAFKNLFFIKRNNVPVIAYNNSTLQSIDSIHTCHFSLADSDNI